MTGINELKTMLADMVPYYVQDRHDKSLFRVEKRRLYERCDPLIMKEEGEGATLTKVNIIGFTQPSLALKPDHFGIRFFKGSRNKACDYLILTTYKEKNYAIFVELKSSLNDDPGLNKGLLIIESKEDQRKEQQILGAFDLFEWLRFWVNKDYGHTDLDGVIVAKIILYAGVTPRSQMYSKIRPVDGNRRRSKDVYTFKVHDAETIELEVLINKALGV